MSQITETHQIDGADRVAVTKRPRRADAQRNYDRVLAVTRDCVAEQGSDIVLEDIARRAGVGIGTLYRHFPTRQDLLEAAFLDEAQELTARAEALADGLEGDTGGGEAAWDALVVWLRAQLAFGTRGRCMGAAVLNAKHTEGSDIQVACVAMRESGAVLLTRAQEAGAVRAQVEMPDLLRLMHGIVLANEQAPEPERAERMFELVMAGIRA
jgi:AcrR family transcriptional regulator